MITAEELKQLNAEYSISLEEHRVANIQWIVDLWKRLMRTPLELLEALQEALVLLDQETLNSAWHHNISEAMVKIKDLVDRDRV